MQNVQDAMDIGSIRLGGSDNYSHVCMLYVHHGVMYSPGSFGLGVLGLSMVWMA